MEVKREEFEPILPGQQESLTIKQLAGKVRRRLAKTDDLKARRELEQKVLNWLCNFIRKRVKRGRVFALGEVLKQGYADCLGYAKLLKAFGREFGLDIGIVDVIIDNAGRKVPHQANILRLADKRIQLVDLWYGSKDINHRRIGARVKEKGKWEARDIDRDELDKVEDIKGLSEGSIKGIDYYILGNRFLNSGELDKAIDCYTKGIRLYPRNARLYFNRAIAYELKGQTDKAKRDYNKAVKSEDGLIRILAREHEEVTQLIELDRKNITPEEQEMFLLYKGFITGQELSPSQIAEKYGLPEAVVKQSISAVEEVIIGHPG